MSEKTTASQTTESKSNTSPVSAGKTEYNHRLAHKRQILQLQRRIGNSGVQKLYASGRLSAKLKIGKPGDKYEQEADRVAGQIMNMPEPLIRAQPG